MSEEMKTYEADITQKGHTIKTTATVQAKNLSDAKRLFAMQYPDCHVNYVREA